MLSKDEINAWDRYLTNSLLLLDHVFGPSRVDTLFRDTKTRVQNRITRELSKKGKGQRFPVERTGRLTPREFKEEFLYPGRPVVMEGAASDWPCVKKWSFDFFAEKYGDEDNLLLAGKGLASEGDQANNDALSLRGIIKDIRVGGASYLKFSALMARRPELQNDIDMDYLRQLTTALSMGSSFQLFLGGANGITPLHNALTCNLFVMVHGEKDWFLYPAFYTPVVQLAITRTTYNHSSVDIHDPDPVEYPGFEFINRYEVRLRPGDIFFVPPYMWHQVENRSETVAVSYRFPDFRGAMKASMTLTIMRFLATNPSFFQTFYYSFINRDQSDRPDGFKTPKVFR